MAGSKKETVGLTQGFISNRSIENMVDVRWPWVVMVLVVLGLQLQLQVAQAQVFGFYNTKNCPNAEAVVTQVVTQAFNQDPTIAPALLRMLFHDCFVEV